MSFMPAFLSVDHVLAIHQRMINEFGGEAGTRDLGLLESAVAMPFAQFAGQFLHEDIPAMSAAYLFHLCRNHPFVDGNKRTALASAEVFLLLNGMKLTASDDELENLTLDLASGKHSKEKVTAFFCEHAMKK